MNNLGKMLAALMVATMSLTVAPLATANDGATCPASPTTLTPNAQGLAVASDTLSAGADKAYKVNVPALKSVTFSVISPVGGDGPLGNDDFVWRVLTPDGSNCHTERDHGAEPYASFILPPTTSARDVYLYVANEQAMGSIGFEIDILIE